MQFKATLRIVLILSACPALPQSDNNVEECKGHISDLLDALVVIINSAVADFATKIHSGLNEWYTNMTSQNPFRVHTDSDSGSEEKPYVPSIHQCHCNFEALHFLLGLVVVMLALAACMGVIGYYNLMKYQRPAIRARPVSMLMSDIPNEDY